MIVSLIDITIDFDNVQGLCEGIEQLIATKQCDLGLSGIKKKKPHSL
jgi:hypothetical protein